MTEENIIIYMTDFLFPFIITIIGVFISVYIAIHIYRKTSLDTKLLLLFQDGNNYYNLGNYTNAKKSFESCLQLKPDRKSVLRNLSSTYGQINQWDKVIDICKKLRQIDSNDFTAITNLGLAYEHINQINDAKNIYLLGLENDPNDPNILFNLGKLYQFKLNDLDKALECYEKIIQDKLVEKNDLINTILSIGEIYVQKNQLPKAIKLYNDALIIDPHNVISLHHKSEILFLQKKFDDVIRCCVIIEKLDPKYAKHLPVKAKSYFEKSSNICLGIINEFLTNHPNDSSAHYSKGIFLYKFNQKDEALKEWNLVLSLNPNFINAYTNIATHYYKKRYYQKTISVLERALSIDSKNITILNMLGEVYTLNKDYPSAINAYLPILNIDPLNINNLQNISNVLAKIKNYSLATEFWNASNDLKLIHKMDK